MGRPKLMKFYHKGRIALSLTKGVIKELDETTERIDQTRSEFIENMLRAALFNEKTYASFMIKQKRLELAYWEYQKKIAEEKAHIKKDQLLAY